MIQVYIDGPIAGETKSWRDAPPIMHIPLPRRITVCECNPDLTEESERAAEVQDYFCLTRGEQVAIYSVERDEEAILRALKYWRITDLTGPWTRGCRDRRAFL
jgi:hypothetical protein